MSRNFDNSAQRSRVPRVAYPFDAYHLPIIYGPEVLCRDEWTLTILVEPADGTFIGASLYNGLDNRGSYFHLGNQRWQFTSYDLTAGQDPVGPEVMRYASSKLQEILGPRATITHSLVPPEHVSGA